MYLQLALGKAIQSETLQRATEHWRGRENRSLAGGGTNSQITLRLAEARDGSALEALASVLDLRDTVLVADVDGQVVAACSLDGTSSFSPPRDPAVGDLLELRALQLRHVPPAPQFRKAVMGGC